MTKASAMLQEAPDIYKLHLVTICTKLLIIKMSKYPLWRADLKPKKKKQEPLTSHKKDYTKVDYSRPSTSYGFTGEIHGFYEIKEEPSSSDDTDIEDLYTQAKNTFKSNIKEEENDDNDTLEPELQLLRFTCTLCTIKKPMNNTDLQEHFDQNHQGYQYFKFATQYKKCDVCSKDFKSIRSLKAHTKSHNNEYGCEVCYITFKKVLNYVLHMRIHDDDDVFKCTFCEFKIGSINDIANHIKAHDKSFKYKCGKCNQGFYDYTWYSEHENYHSGATPFTCEHCGKSFAYSRYLISHRITLHKTEDSEPTRHQCVICKKKYNHRNSLKLHMNNQHLGKIAVCDICGKQCSSNEKLKFHIRIHTGFKPFKCSFCEKAFSRKPMLSEHERVHTGQKPYTCNYCQKGFSQRSSLIIHTRNHTGERFNCERCKKGFTAKATLNVHLKSCTDV